MGCMVLRGIELGVKRVTETDIPLDPAGLQGGIQDKVPLGSIELIRHLCTCVATIHHRY